MDKIYGITLDDPWEYAPIVKALKSLPKRVWVRIVFDEGEGAKDYVECVEAISRVADVMGCILDSSAMKGISRGAYLARTATYFKALQAFVKVWEIGNEINGDWLGTLAAEKAIDAHTYVKGQGGKTALTFYLTSDEDMYRWALEEIPYSMGSKLDWVTVSYYYQDNNDWKPNWQNVFDELADIFPFSKLLVGECGDDRDKDRAKKNFDLFYKNFPVVHEEFIGAYFSWYQAQFIGPHAFLLDDLKGALR